jgi:hypothetical protein
MLERAQHILKSLTAGALAGFAAYGNAVTDGVTGPEWIVIVSAAIGAGLVVWAVPNKPAEA